MLFQTLMPIPERARSWHLQVSQENHSIFIYSNLPQETRVEVRRRHPARGLVSPHDSSEVEIWGETCHLADFSQVLPFSTAKRGPPEDEGEPSLLPILFLCG